MSRLCVECGACCSGLLYSSAELEAGEADFTRSIGLELLPKSSEAANDYFRLPCPHLCGTACSIYRQPKPSICSTYFCKLAASLDRGEVGQAEAMERVHELHQRLDQVKPVLAADENWTMARKRWRENLNRGGPLDPGEARFQMLMTALNLFVDRHFRRKSEKSVSLEELQ